MPAKKINTFSGFSFLEVSGMDDNDNVIELSMNKKKRYDPYQQVPVTQQDANNKRAMHEIVDDFSFDQTSSKNLTFSRKKPSENRKENKTIST